MLKIKSVFVLGAAQAHLSAFPPEFNYEQCGDFVKERSSHVYDILTNSGLSFSQTELNMFGEALYYSGKNSVTRSWNTGKIY